MRRCPPPPGTDLGGGTRQASTPARDGDQGLPGRRRGDWRPERRLHHRAGLVDRPRRRRGLRQWPARFRRPAARLRVLCAGHHRHLRAARRVELAELVAGTPGVRGGEVDAANRADDRPARASQRHVHLVQRPDPPRHPRLGRPRRLLRQVPAPAGDGRVHPAADAGGGAGAGLGLGRDHRRHPAADPAVHDHDRPAHPGAGASALPGADQARQPLCRPDHRAAHPAGLRTRPRAAAWPAVDRGRLADRDDEDAANRLPEWWRAGTARHPLGGPGRGQRRLPGGRLPARPDHCAVHPDPGAGGVHPGPRGRRALPRLGRRHSCCRSRLRDH